MPKKQAKMLIPPIQNLQLVHAFAPKMANITQDVMWKTRPIH